MFPLRGLWVKSILLVALCGTVVGCPTPEPRQLALSVTPNLLEFGTSDTPLTFEVRTNMDTPQAISITSTVPASAPWLSVDPAIGTSAAPTQPFTVTVRVDRTKLKKGLNTATISVGSPGLVSRAVTVTASTLIAADFVGDPKEIWQGEQVSFEDLSEVVAGETPITVRDWDFGDGTPHASGETPTHTYTTPGKKTVVLTVRSKNPDGSTRLQDVETKVDYITVNRTIPPTAAFTTTPAAEDGVINTIINTPIEFTDQSDKPTGGTAAITSWYWDFGDGQNSTVKNPSHAYADPGTYSVSLTVTSEHGTDTETRANLVVVSAGTPVALFTPPSGTLLANTPIGFVDESKPGAAAIAAWSWNFGDGQVSSARNPSHTFANGGTYTVTLTVTTPYGSNSVSHAVTITEREPEAIFDLSPENPKVNETIQFTDRSDPGTAPITAWRWSFGDGKPVSTLKNPTRTYTTAGTYVVSLRVTTAHGEDTVEETVVVRTEAPTASFTATPTSSYVNHNIQFTSTSNAGTAPITSWLWTFGDGQQSTAENPVHKYAQTGSYTVSLTVTSAHGHHTATIANYIKVDPAVAPAANFTMSSATPYEADEVRFTDTSTNGTSVITAWQWEFGDGGTSAARNPVHIYTQPGTFQVSLTVTSSDGTHAVTKNIVVVPNVDPVANFSATPLTPLAGTAVKFKDLSTPGTSPIISWLWNFGDTESSAADNMSVEQNPSHTYSAPGVYTVTLKVATLHGTNEVSKAQYLVVRPLVDFVATPTNAAVGKGVKFTDLTNPGTSSVASRLWQFGDGLSSTEASPNHVYGRAGTFTVTLTVTLASGASGTATKVAYITAVMAPPTANFTASNFAPRPYEVVRFTDASDSGSAPIRTWLWDFGDGTTSSAQNPSHTYTEIGDYDVTLTVESALGSSTITKKITVTNLEVTASFTIDKRIAYRNVDRVTLTSTSTVTGTARFIEYHWTAVKSDDPSISVTIHTSTPTLVFEPGRPSEIWYSIPLPGIYDITLEALSSTLSDPDDILDPENHVYVRSGAITMKEAIEIREPNPLDRFVHDNEPYISATKESVTRATVNGMGYSRFVVKLIAHSWNAYATYKDTATPSIWTHFLTIVQPDNLTNDTALLYLQGGDRTDPPPTTVDPALSSYAVESGSVVAVMTGIPNQPLSYSRYGETNMTEDRLLSATIHDFLNPTGVSASASASNLASRMLLFPMVKSVVRGMDAVQKFLASPASSGNVPPVKIKDFVLAGGSEEGLTRGWVTWLVPTTDERVRGIIPIGFDFLSLHEQLPHQYASLGGYSSSLSSYWAPYPTGFPLFGQMSVLNPEDYMYFPLEVHRMLVLLQRMHWLIDGASWKDEMVHADELRTLADGILEEIAGFPLAQGSALPRASALSTYMEWLFEGDDRPTDEAGRWGAKSDLIDGLTGGYIIELENALRTLEQNQYSSWCKPAFLMYTIDPLHYSYSTFQAGEPYSPYYARLNLPKYIVNSTGDETSMPDSAQYYAPLLAGTNYLRYYPNTGHDMGGQTDALHDTLPWFKSVVNAEALPRFTWEYYGDGFITLSFPDGVAPLGVTMWAAASDTLDFRNNQANPPQWFSSEVPLEYTSTGDLIAQVYPSVSDTNAYYLEVRYLTSGGEVLTGSTPVRLVPPYESSFKSANSSMALPVEEPQTK